MSPAVVTVLVVVAGVLALLAVFAFARSLGREEARRAERETERLRLLLEEVKEVAWTNRDIAPELSTIIIDTIRSEELEVRRRQLP